MTNSIASAKCPTVLSSGKYGMSQNRLTDDSKEYVYVRLTDSAFRAVEEYNAKRFPNGQCAKIQVEGNSGFIQFPTFDSAKGDRKFGFTLDDVDGSLECIQQTPDGLNVLGSLQYRMRIHANDDSYDTTRTKMAIAEETEKSKCIREIKPNQTDIGRKVKKSSSSFHHHSSSNQGVNANSGNSNNNSSNLLSNSNSRSKSISSSNSLSQLNGATSSNGGVVGVGTSRSGPASSSSSRSPNPTMLGGSGTTGSSTSNGGNSNSCNRYASHGLYSQNNANSLSSALPSLTSASSLSSTFAGGISNGYSSVSTGSPPEPLVSVAAPAPTNKSKLGSSNYGGGGSNGRGNASGGIVGPSLGVKGGGVSKNSGNSSGGSKLPDISRRKIRERLIHLLALKNFKKPELYSRLTNEGIRDRERSLISNVLKDISTMSRDNTYNLRRQMWNDVNENWPFYTEQELQQLKRRKPQNLTPPISDAGSSTSGQSPTSTHTGSPPPLVGSGGNGGLKRASLEGGGFDESTLMGPQPKKQRISHFKKDAMGTSSAGCAASASSSSSGANRIGGYSSSGGNASQNKNVVYSPHGHSAQEVDDNSHNSDLTFNVLENVDDFMTHVEQGSTSYFGGSVPPSSNNVRKINGGSNNANNKSAGSVKEKRSAGIGQQKERTSNKELMKKSCSSPTPYVMNFVPEANTSSSGSNSRVGANGVGTTNSNFSNNSFQHNSPNNSQQHHKSNSVVSKQGQTASPRDEANSTNRSSGSIGRYAQPVGGRSSVKATRTPTPPNQHQQQLKQHPQTHQQQQHQQTTQQQHHSQPYHHQPPQNLSSSSSSPLQQQQHQQQQHQPAQKQTSSISSPPLQQQHQQLQQTQPPPLQYQQKQLQQQHASPTQQIAAAASSYASAANGTSKAKPCYDFSNYTPITNITQRRQYKTEFETDYDEYRKLLAQIEGVGMHFRELAVKLENARQGCADYDEIKQRIVSEYEKIQNEETLKNDKLRFDYLHAKLAHIKQSVTDYDNALTAAAAALRNQELLLQQQAQQPQQQQYSTHIETIDTNNILAASRNSRLSPMVSGGESNNSPPSYQQQLTHSQQQYAPHYQQHHDAETIQQQHTQPHAVTTTQHHPSPTSEQQSPPSPSNNINSSTATQQYQQHQQPHQYYNSGHHASHQSGNNSNNDCNSDSDDSSDSNSNDEDDDDDSNSNTNDEDNVDKNDHY